MQDFYYKLKHFSAFICNKTSKILFIRTKTWLKILTSIGQDQKTC